MAWKKLTRAVTAGGEAYVNMAKVSFVLSHTAGAVLFFDGPAEDGGMRSMHVAETPDQIMMAPALRFNDGMNKIG